MLGGEAERRWDSSARPITQLHAKQELTQLFSSTNLDSVAETQ
jgi:hypothetical protein